MKVVYSEAHRKHAPPYQFSESEKMAYPEVPARAEAILLALKAHAGTEVVSPRPVSSTAFREVHDAGYLHFLAHAYEVWAEGREGVDAGLIPDTFAMRTLPGRPAGLDRMAGYYCFETQTPILKGTWAAAREAAACALTGADLLLSGEGVAYALCRPPGHHAGRDLYGGYCYLNNAAIAAWHLGREGRAAVLDVDYHHGNGTQAIFYGSDAVMFVSIHADPGAEYPYFSGFADETGEGAGLGFNRNFPLPAGTGPRVYLETLDRALETVGSFGPDFLVLSLGVDTYEEDPLGKFELPEETFEAIGKRLQGRAPATLLVQEGGYSLEGVGTCVARVLDGFTG